MITMRQAKKEVLSCWLVNRRVTLFCAVIFLRLFFVVMVLVWRSGRQ